MRTLRVKNWEQFQHYKHRSPPWIKLHRQLIEDYAFSTLKDRTKAHLMLIWILAAGNAGVIPGDATFIARKIGATDPIDLDAMIEAGFLVVEDEGTEQAADQPASDGNGEDKSSRGTTFKLTELPEAWREFCAAERPNADPEKLFFQFRDHWLANANQRTGRKSDWAAAWRTWVRREKPF